MYFKYYTAWRSAFFDMLELEQPEDVSCQGRENRTGLRYIPYTQPSTKITNERQQDTSPNP